RLELFSDAVIAIIITITVLELRAPEGSALADLGRLWPTFATYALSFVLLRTYWANHHHLLQTAKTVDGRVLWANLHLLFWLSLALVAPVIAMAIYLATVILWIVPDRRLESTTGD